VDTPLRWACYNGHVQVVNELVEHEANIIVKNNDGWTPLHVACYHGHEQVVNELLSPGVEIRPNDSNGATSSRLGKRKSRGATIEEKDNDGNTPTSTHRQLVPFGYCSGVAEQGREHSRSQQSRRTSNSQSSVFGKVRSGQVSPLTFYATTRCLPLDWQSLR
jgi:hypothetical protein